MYWEDCRITGWAKMSLLREAALTENAELHRSLLRKFLKELAYLI